MTSDTLILPNTFIIGSAKSGTTTLRRVLRVHPQAVLTVKREPCFFAFPQEYEKGLEYYSSLFTKTEQTKVIIDHSTPYSRCTIYPHVPQRIYDVVPDAKFIYIMRHPVDRAYAHYKHSWLKEVHPGEPFTETFEDYVKHEPVCLDDSLYKLQIEEYLKYFNQKQFLFILTDDLEKDPSSLMYRIFDYLEIDKNAEILLEKSQPVRGNDSNKTLERIVRNQIRSLPIIKSLKFIVPSQLRDVIYNNIISKTNISKNVEKSFTPLPMKKETRKELIEYYSETIAWVEEVTETKLPHWYQ